jgi:hypothetical protein
VYRLGKLLRLSNSNAICRSLLQADAKASYGKLSTQHPSLTEGTEAILPAWLLPHHTKAERTKYRPDILCMALDSKHTLDGDDYLQVIKQHATFHIIEVGFSGDTFYERHLARKLAQHAHLIHLLRQEGWRVHAPSPVLFGQGGTLYQSTWDSLIHTFQLPSPSVTRFFHKTQRLAAHTAHQIVVSRRQIEKEKL